MRRTTTSAGLDRRRFLAGASGMGVALAMGPTFWERALAAPAVPGASPYGPLLAPNGDGLQLPTGFTSRVVARSLTPVGDTGFLWHPFPDGGACVPTGDGGWIYVSNSENPPPAVDLPLPPVVGDLLGDVLGLGGASAIRFAADGTVVDAYSILGGTRSNCAGGLTPWGTWLSCEEWEAPADGGAAYDAGQVWECDPFGRQAAVVRPGLGRFKHEMAAVDPERHHVYLSEDQSDGLLYRFTPPPNLWGTGAAFDDGTLEAMAVDDRGRVTWLAVVDGAAPSAPLRSSVPGAARFDGGEGILYDSGRVYLTTKGDDRVWVHDVEAQTMQVLYDGRADAQPVLDGVDNIAVSASGDLYVAEDGGNLEVCVITPDLVVAPVVRMTGPEHGFDNGTPLPTVSEVTGLAFSPDGNRLYLNSERGGVVGILYEVTGPWRGGSLAAEAAAPPSTTPTTPDASAATTTPAPAEILGESAGGALPRTGGAGGGWLGAAAAAGAAALWRLRRRVRT